MSEFARELRDWQKASRERVEELKTRAEWRAMVDQLAAFGLGILEEYGAPLAVEALRALAEDAIRKAED